MGWKKISQLIFCSKHCDDEEGGAPSRTICQSRSLASRPHRPTIYLGGFFETKLHSKIKTLQMLRKQHAPYGFRGGSCCLMLHIVQSSSPYYIYLFFSGVLSFPFFVDDRKTKPKGVLI